jgi:uncharacterized membrane protein
MAGKNANWIFFGGIATAAAAAFLLDRKHGNERRVKVARLTQRLVKTVADGTALGVRDTRHRIVGMAKHAWFALGRQQLEDRVLEERIRSRMGRIVSQPHKVRVTSDDGVVTLWGQVSEQEARMLADAVSNMRGVRQLMDHLEVREDAAERAHRGDPVHLARNLTVLNWSPSRRLITSLAGVAVATYGWRRQDDVGAAISLVGAGLAAQCWMKHNVHSMLALTEDCPGFALERTLKINAPISDIFDFWSNPENYPKVFSHIAAVERLGENLYRWTITGPAGIPIHWEGMITRTVPNTLVEWKSLPGSTVGNFGVARFDPNYDASTRLHLRMFYRPPAGILGRFLAELLGASPKKVLDRDLARLKQIFEKDEYLVKTLTQGGDEQLLKIATT